MENKTEWFAGFENEVMKHPLSGREYRLFNIPRFIRYGNRVDYYSNDCTQCMKFKQELMRSARDLKALLSSENRQSFEFEQLNDRVYRHLRKEHGLIPRSYYLSVYSLAGMLIGTAGLGFAGFLADLLTGNQDFRLAKNGLLFGWFFGLVAGQILGNRKDKKIKKQNRQF